MTYAARWRALYRFAKKIPIESINMFSYGHKNSSIACVIGHASKDPVFIALGLEGRYAWSRYRIAWKIWRPKAARETWQSLAVKIFHISEDEYYKCFISQGSLEGCLREMRNLARRHKWSLAETKKKK